MLRSSCAAARSSFSAAATALSSRRARQALSRSICSASTCGDTVRIGVGGAGERRGFGLDEPVDADHDLLAALDRLDAARVRFDQLLLHVALLDRGDRAAHRLDVRELLLAPRA